MLPVLLSIGPVKIYSMGVMMAIGILSSMYWWWKMGGDEHWDEIVLFDAYFLSMLGFLLLGRMAYLVTSSESEGIIGGLSLLSKPGLNYWVGFVGVGIVMTMMARAKEWEIWKMWDALSVSVMLALVWGSIGTLLNRGEIVLDLWGIVWSVVGFGVVSTVRKNFRFYSWYKGVASVAKDGLAALVGVGLVGVYYLGRAVIERSWVMGGVGLGMVILIVVVVWRRTGTMKLPNLAKKPKRRKR